MAHDETNRTDRRTFLQAGALATASAAEPGARRRRRRTAAAKAADAPHAAAGQDRRRDHDPRPGGRPGAGRSTASSGSPTPTASAPSTPPRPTAPSPTSRSGSSRSPEVRKQIFLVTKDTPKTPGADARRCSTSGSRPSGPTTSTSSSSTASATTTRLDDAIEPGQEQGVQGDGRGDPEVGQGEVRRLLDPPQGPRPDHPGGGRGRDRRRDHAPVHPLARQGRAAEQGARRLPQEGASA